MGAPLSIDLRSRIVEKREAGFSAAEISEMFRVSLSSVYRFCKLQREQGNVNAGKLGQPARSKLDAHAPLIQKWIQEQPGLTLAELTHRCVDELNLSVHHTTILRVLRKWGYRYKKNDLRQGTESP